MKKLKRLSVTATYTVDWENVALPDSVYNDIVSLYDSDVYRIEVDSPDNTERNVCDWFSENVLSQFCSSISYEIDNLETD